jgi:hypothetical protein
MILTISTYLHCFFKTMIEMAIGIWNDTCIVYMC